MPEKATINRMMIPCYLNLDEYIMFKDLADRDMRTMSGLLRVLIHREATEQGISPEEYAAEAEELRKERQKKYNE